MEFETYYYNCTASDIDAIDPHLQDEVRAIIRMLPQRETLALISEDLFWLFTHKGWCFDTIPPKSRPECPFELDIMAPGSPPGTP